MKHTHYSTTL